MSAGGAPASTAGAAGSGSRRARRLARRLPTWRPRNDAVTVLTHGAAHAFAAGALITLAALLPAATVLTGRRDPRK